MLLKRFARNTRSRGWELHSFDTKHPEGSPKLKGPKGCGKIPNFIRFASRSSEELWEKVEHRLPAALAAADNESIVHYPGHIATIKDAIALHFVRSIQMATVHEWVWRTVKAAHRQQLLNQPELLERLFREQVGLHAAGRRSTHLAFNLRNRCAASSLSVMCRPSPIRRSILAWVCWEALRFNKQQQCCCQ